jgi:hypothetical protein
MKLTVEILDEFEDRAIYVMAGVELAAYRLPSGEWQVKTSRCNQCGKCCKGLKKHSFPLIDGQCVHLKKEPGNNDQWLCGMALSRPFACCIGIPNNMADCTEKYKEGE